MGQGMNIRVQNATSFTVRFDDYEECCMTSDHTPSQYFGTGNTVNPKGSTGGYVEAKGSGTCAFKVSNFSFQIKLDRGEGQAPITIARIKGEPNKVKEDADYATITSQDLAGDYIVERAFTHGGGQHNHPAFTFTVKAR